MDKGIKRLSALKIGDVELECNCDSLSIEDLNITHIGFNQNILDQFDLIIYEGIKGTKILKSVYTKTGVVE